MTGKRSVLMSDSMPSPELATILRTLRQQWPQLAERYQVRSASVFGSYVRSEQDQQSDIDIVVSFIEPPGLLKYVEFENDLTDILGIPVDLVMQDALRPAIRERVQNEMIAI
jgi:predicted nucleotidyltransferase